MLTKNMNNDNLYYNMCSSMHKMKDKNIQNKITIFLPFHLKCKQCMRRLDH